MTKVNVNQKQDCKQKNVKEANTMKTSKNTELKTRLQQILYIALPLIIQGLVFQLQSLTDKAFLGHLDTKYVSAAGAAQMPYVATVDSVMAIGMGLIIIVAKLYGAGEHFKIQKYVESTAFYHTLLGVVLFLIWQFGAESILTFFKVDQAIIKYSLQYVRICTVYLIFIGIDCALQGMLQGMGQTKPIMYAGIIKVILNIIISWILIFGKFGCPALNVAGAAIGTLAANLLSFVFILFYCMVLKREQFRLHTFDRGWLNVAPYRQVIALGVPVGLEFLLWHFSNLILIRFINGFSYQDMAIYSLTFGFQCIIFVIFSGTSKATLTLIGQNIGAGHSENADQFFYTTIILNFLIVAAAAALFFSVPGQLLRIFSNDTAMITQAVPYLGMIGVIMFPQSMNVICGNAIRAHDDTRWMLLSQVLGSTLVISISWFMVDRLHMGMMAIYITLFMDETIRGGINFLYYKKRYGNHKSAKIVEMPAGSLQ